VILPGLPSPSEAGFAKGEPIPAFGIKHPGIAPSAIHRHDASVGGIRAIPIMTFGRLRGPCIATLVALAVLTGTVLVAAEDADIARRRAIERKTFSNAEIIDGFFKITFGAEFHIAGGVDRIRKYDGPIRVYVDNKAKPDRSSQVGAVVADIRMRIRDLDIAMTSRRDDAQIIVSLVHDRDLAHAIRTLYGIDRARRIQRSLEPQCLSGFRKDENVFYDCIYEELLQSLGPINDDTTVPWSMFNDDVQMGFFDLYDQYLLNILYDRRIRPGMTRTEVEALLPEVLPQVRAWVEGNNKP
jgi:hypothetical protein